MLHHSQAMEIHAKCNKYFVVHPSVIGSTKRNDNAEHHDKAVIQGAKIKRGVKKANIRAPKYLCVAGRHETLLRLDMVLCIAFLRPDCACICGVQTCLDNVVVTKSEKLLSYAIDVGVNRTCGASKGLKAFANQLIPSPNKPQQTTQITRFSHSFPRHTPNDTPSA
jgi:hypothetical protein